MPRPAPSALLALIVLAVSAIPADAARLTRRGHASSIGQFTSVSVNGLDVRRPGQIQFRVVGNPRARVELSWRMDCDLPNYGSASRSATRRAGSPIRFTPTLPRGNLLKCSVSATAQFVSYDRGGRITLEVWARPRP